jgi:integrase
VHKGNHGVKTDLLSCITTFFNWLQATGRWTTGNPVNSFLHRQKKPKRLPRPLSAEELKLAWELLGERGDARLRLAFAIGEESGMRIGKICRLRVSDVDAAGHRLFVRLPNKTDTERYSHFGPKTAKYLTEWLAERDASCETNSLIYNYAKSKNPFNTNTLGIAFNRVLRKDYEGKSHERGFEKWSTHRLRHTMGTNLAAGGADAAVIMAAGGWVEPDTMAGYVKVNPVQAKRSYEEAMRRAEQQHREAPKTRILTPRRYSCSGVESLSSLKTALRNVAYNQGIRGPSVKSRHDHVRGRDRRGWL